MKLYDVTVLVSGKRRPRVVGSWWGVAATPQDAERRAVADVWQSRFEKDGHPICDAREQPQYVTSESWYQVFGVGSQWTTRWVYDRVAGLLLLAELLWDAQAGVWMPVGETEHEHLQETLEGMGVDVEPQEFDGVVPAEAIPLWAVQAVKRALERQQQQGL